MNKRYWKCPTGDPLTDLYIETWQNAATADHHHTEAQTTEAHMSAAREAFYYYAEPRRVELTEAIHEVTELPPRCSKVAWGIHGGTNRQPLSVEATVYKVVADAAGDGIDPERGAALEGAITELYEVIYALEGLLDEEEDKYPDLPCSMRAAAYGEPSGKDRLKIESAIFLLYRAQRVMQDLE